MSDEDAKSFTSSGISTAPKLLYIGDRMRVEFEGDCLKQDKSTYSHGVIIYIYIVYKLFGAVCSCHVTYAFQSDMTTRT